MWSDNEAEIDLLGFDYLVASLVAVLNERHLLPLTVGVNGDWGSGKSSLIRMTAQRLRCHESGFIVIEFNPWVYEDSQGLKYALIATILDELRSQLPENARSRIQDLWSLVARIAHRSRAAGPIVAGGFAATGAPPEVGVAAGAMAESALGAAADSEGSGSSHLSVIDEFLAPREFRSLFGDLIQQLNQRTVVVLVDDLDRCLPDTVVTTFETIRLFLSVPGTAFVIAAHRQMVEQSVESRYPNAEGSDGSLGRDYLEKLLQVFIHIPPLSAPESETYLTLLLCQLHLESGKFLNVVKSASSHYRGGQLGIAMNEGRVKSVLGEISEELGSDLRWVTSIAPVISGGLRGNPRQLKRFLNTLRLRAKTSEFRGVTLDHPTLAKLMVLEETDNTAFETLFNWQIEHSGSPPQLATAEANSELTETETAEHSSSTRPASATSEAINAWMERPTVARWLTLEPPLAGVDLGPYLYLIRDRFAPGGVTSRLPAQLQSLIRELSSSSRARRRIAVERALQIPEEDLNQLGSALADRARRAPRDPVAISLIEISAVARSIHPLLISALKNVPPTAIPPAMPAILLLRFKDDMPKELTELLNDWEAQSDAPKLSAAVRIARKVDSS